MNSRAALEAAVAVAQADRKVSKAEIHALEQLIALEGLDGWDAIDLKAHLGKAVDLESALSGIEDDVDRRYAVALCYVMAFVEGISPPETTVLNKVAARWGFGPEKVAECRREGETLFQRLNL